MGFVGHWMLGGGTGRTVTVKVKYADFRIVTRQETLQGPTDDGAEICGSQSITA